MNRCVKRWVDRDEREWEGEREIEEGIVEKKKEGVSEKMRVEENIGREGCEWDKKGGREREKNNVIFE